MTLTGLHEGQLVRFEISASDVKAIREKYESLAAWSKAHCALLAVTPAMAEKHASQAKFASFLGESFWDSMLIASEPGRTLASRAGRMKPPGADVEGTGEVELLVLARRDDAALMAAQHPVATDLRVEVDVHFVAVEDGLFCARARFQPSNFGQNALPRVTRPRAEHDGFGRSEPSPDPRQGAAHRANGDGGPSLCICKQSSSRVQVVGATRSPPAYTPTSTRTDPSPV